MFRHLFYSILIFAVASFMPLTLSSQYDDLYYNPDDFQSTTLRNNIYSGSDISFGDQDYDNQSYEYFDDYDFYYSSRIRRFHRPTRGVDFYDPYYVDLVYYGYHNPGITIYISPYSYRQFSHRPYSYHHYHHHNPFYNPYYAWHNPWRPYRPFGGFHSYGFGYGYGYSGLGGFGYRACPIFYTSNHYYANNYYSTRPGSDTNRPSDDIRSRRGTQYGPAGSTGGAAPRSGRSASGGTNDDGVVGTPSDERTTTSQRGRIAAPGNDERIDSGDREIQSQRGDRSTNERVSPSERVQQENIRGRTSNADIAGTGSSIERVTTGRQAQQNFRDNRVNRDQYQTDRRSNVPLPSNVDRTRSTQQRTPAFDGRSPQRSTPSDFRGNQGRTNEPASRGIDQNRGRQQYNPDINRNQPTQRSTPPSFDNNRRSNDRGSGINPSSRNNQRSPAVSPPSSNPPRSSGSNTGGSSNRSSSSDSPRSGRSGRGG